MIVAAILLIGLLARSLPRLLIDALATVIALVLMQRSRWVERTLLSNVGNDPDSEATFLAPWRGRRLMRRHLKLALRMVELRGLFPCSVARAEALIDHRRRAHD